MIKLIASDVDGTLVSDGGGKLDERIVDMIKEFILPLPPEGSG